MSPEEPATPQQPTPGSKRGWIISALVVLALGLTGVWLWHNRPEEAKAPPKVTAEEAVPTPPGKSLEEEAAHLPALADSDALARGWAVRISTAQAFAGFLAAPDLLRRWVALVGSVADGERPSPLLAGLGVKGEFTTREEGSRHYVAQASYDRYRPLAEAIGSLDVALAADGYRALRPLIALAWREIGRPNRTFDQALELAISHLLATPTPPGEVELLSKGALYIFKDPALEGASPAQKQLLRMGPDNGRIVKEKLRELARVLK
ncbi:MAG: DUF3014 domain-containing protein, partial [Myxococcaceae bacterium]